MVGRGGRSRACFICRHRRLKCDETKPLCLRCKHSGFECTGYPDQLPFIHDDPASRLQRQTRSPSRKSIEIPAPEAALSVLCDDLYFAYLKQELRNGSSLLDGQWPGFSALKTPDDLSRRCITSFAASFFGRATSNDRARKEGIHMYADSLKELNHRLSQPHAWPAGQTVVAIGILTLYEYLTSSSRGGWVQHMLGLAAFFRLQGFETFKQPYVITQFESNRFGMITASITGKQPYHLASPDWLALPWSFAQKDKDQRQHLFDHASRLPELYLGYLNYVKSTDIAETTRLDLMLETKMKVLLYALRDWEGQWRSELNSPVEEVPVPEDEQGTCGFTTTLIFDDIDDTSYTFVIYNTILVMLLELWKALKRTQATKNQSPPSPMTPVSDGSPAQKWSDDYLQGPSVASLISQSRKAALDICRALPQYKSASGSWGHAIQVVIAIRMAIVVFRQIEGSPQTSWLVDILREIGESRQGWEIGKHTMENVGYY